MPIIPSSHAWKRFMFVRDASLRLYSNCTHLKKPSEIIRHLEDEFSKAEMKLSNFPDLMLKEPDRVSVLLQAIPNEVRQCVVLRGKSGKWDESVDSCKFYEQQLRMVDAASMRQVEQQILCPYCGKKGRAKKDCWKWQRERGGKDDAKGKHKGDGKGKDGGKQGYGKGKEKGKRKGDGKGKDDGKGKKKKFKKDKRHRSRSASSDGSHASNDGQRSTAGGSPSQGLL